MSHRQPRLKDQAKQLRAVMAKRGLNLGTGESLELVSRMNGYPSWNVASQYAELPAQAGESTRMAVRVWTAVHHHRHGEDTFLFTHQPTEAEVIDAIQAVSSWEPDEGESIDILGADVLGIDLSVEVARQAALQAPKLVGTYEVDMTELFEYSVPESVAEWAWVESRASFSHKGNGTDAGVWEFMVHRSKFVDEERNTLHDDVPKSLHEELFRALQLGAAWALFHQG